MRSKIKYIFMLLCACLLLSGCLDEEEKIRILAKEYPGSTIFRNPLGSYYLVLMSDGLTLVEVEILTDGDGTYEGSKGYEGSVPLLCSKVDTSHGELYCEEGVYSNGVVDPPEQDGGY